MSALFRFHRLTRFGMGVEKRKDVRGAGSENAAMIAAWNFDVLVRHL